MIAAFHRGRDALAKPQKWTFDRKVQHSRSKKAGQEQEREINPGCVRRQQPIEVLIVEMGNFFMREIKAVGECSRNSKAAHA